MFSAEFLNNLFEICLQKGFKTFQIELKISVLDMEQFKH